MGQGRMPVLLWLIRADDKDSAVCVHGRDGGPASLKDHYVGVHCFGESCTLLHVRGECLPRHPSSTSPTAYGRDPGGECILEMVGGGMAPLSCYGEQVVRRYLDLCARDQLGLRRTPDPS